MPPSKPGYLAGVLLLLCITGSFPAKAREILTFTTLDEPKLVEVNRTILAEAYSRLGFEIEVLVAPAERALVTANEGKADGELMRIPGLSQQYPNLIMIPVPSTSIDMMAYTKGLSFSVRGWQSLRPYHLGIPIGVKISEKNTIGMNRHFANTYKQLLLMLNADRIDVVIVDRLGGEYEIQQLGLSELKPLEPPIATIQLHHYLHKKHRHLVAPLTAVMEQLIDEGFPQGVKRRAISP